MPEHVQDTAFREAFRSIWGTGPAKPRLAVTEPGSGAAPNIPGDSSTDPNNEGQQLTEDEVIAAVAEHTGVPVERLERVFHLDDGSPKLLLAGNRLGNSAAEKTRATAQILTVVRKVGMGQPDTSYDVIRAECERLHFYDSKNFASQHLPRIEGFGTKGAGHGRRLEARNGGIAAFPTLIDRVLGES